MKSHIDCDVLCIGAGIMSSTLAALLLECNPNLTIEIIEKLGTIAEESSNAWNNAGTGHSALCELNYTPEKNNGEIETEKAIKIFESFQLSKQFWSYLNRKNYFNNEDLFIHKIPHFSLVFGEKDIQFLTKRHELLSKFPHFNNMEISTDKTVLNNWFPLIFDGRKTDKNICATRAENGTDIDFGALTRNIFLHLQQAYQTQVKLNTEVIHLEQTDTKNWLVYTKNKLTGEEKCTVAKFVFIGAGGGTLPLLEKSNIEQGKHYGGFPVSGQWLICKNETIIAQHFAKVYGKAKVGAPPMSVPHLDTRIIDGKHELLFGPYAGFTTKFLKHGSWLDLPMSVHLENIGAMFGAWFHNLPLTKYLVQQVTQSMEERMAELQEFYPNAKPEDWELANAGQRVQIIKKDKNEGGILEFGTELVFSNDNSLAALLGASPGASTSVKIMMQLMEKCFDFEFNNTWIKKIKEMMPTYGITYNGNETLYKACMEISEDGLGLNGKW